MRDTPGIVRWRDCLENSPMEDLNWWKFQGSYDGEARCRLFRSEAGKRNTSSLTRPDERKISALFSGLLTEEDLDYKAGGKVSHNLQGGHGKMIGRRGVVRRRRSALPGPVPHSAPPAPDLGHHVDRRQVGRAHRLLPLASQTPGYHRGSRAHSLAPETSNISCSEGHREIFEQRRHYP